MATAFFAQKSNKFFIPATRIDLAMQRSLPAGLQGKYICPGKIHPGNLLRAYVHVHCTCIACDHCMSPRLRVSVANNEKNIRAYYWF